ncbi:MAG TPA: hypothetical protein VGA78_04810, partial [Gemmatimonadales bacterium]
IEKEDRGANGQEPDCSRDAAGLPHGHDETATLGICQAADPQPLTRPQILRRILPGPPVEVVDPSVERSRTLFRWFPYCPSND